MKKKLIGFLCCLSVSVIQAQLRTGEIIDALPSRNVGFPDGGRFSSLAVYDKDPSIFYAGIANGGVIKTVNGGYSYQVVFDSSAAGCNIGALAVSQKDPNLVWVGTGEPWQRNFVGRGKGVYKSSDGGASWQSMGLEQTNTVAKILIHPKNEQIVFVAAMGDAWSYGKERGIYKTINGGKSWKKVLYTDERSSGVEIIIDPIHPQNMLAALWDHIHRPYGWFESGSGSGMYRSSDGGETWTKVSGGLPQQKVGRICMDYFPKDSKRVVAIIQVPEPGTWVYLSTDGGRTWNPRKGTHGSQKTNAQKWYRAYYNHIVKFHPTDSRTFYYGSPRHVTHDGGDNWEGAAGDDHALWIDPKDPKHYLLCNDISVEQGWNLGSFKPAKRVSVTHLPIMGQVYGVGYDMRKIYSVVANMQDQFTHYIPTQGRSGVVTSGDCAVSLAGDEAGKPMFHPIDIDQLFLFGRPEEKLNVFSFYDRATGAYDLSLSLGYETPSYNDSASFLRYSALPEKTRSGWIPGWCFSKYDPNVIYFGANRLFKTADRGKTWRVISPDLTRDRPELQRPDDGRPYHGDMAESRQYQTIRCVAESPFDSLELWVGTDDGLVQVSRNGGKTWTEVGVQIPEAPTSACVGSLTISKFQKGRVYLTLDDHKNGNYKSYCYVSEDGGLNWKSLTAKLPEDETCYIMKEGLDNPDLLYLGSETGLWISLDRGANWEKYQDFRYAGFYDESPRTGVYVTSPNYFPSVSVFDLEIHPREKDLIIGTHGRGIWILPGAALEQLTTKNLQQDIFFVKPNPIYLFPIRSSNLRHQTQLAANSQPGTLFSYYLREAVEGDAQIAVLDNKGKTMATFSGETKAGLNSVRWIIKDTVIQPGIYSVRLTVGGKDYFQTILAEDVSSELLR